MTHLMPVKTSAAALFATAVMLAGCTGDTDVTGAEPPEPSSASSSSLAAVSSSVPASSSSSSVPASSSAPVVSSSSAPESSSSVASSAPNAPLVYAANVGGPALSFNGIDYRADRFYRGGTPNATEAEIDGISAGTPYHTERYGDMTYQIPVTNGTYGVTLQFVEMYQTATMQRLFSASVEGEPVVQSIDLYAEVGGNAAYDVEVPMVMVADETLTIELMSEMDNATLSGITLYSETGEYVEPPEPEPGQPIASAGCGSANTYSDGRHNLNVNGTNRSFIVRLPQNYNAQTPYRLIMAYHWLNGNASQVAEGGMGGSTDDPFYGLWDLADNTTIFVAPEGIDAGWANTNGRDINFTDAMIDELTNDLCVDENRIFATGFSYGAGMSNAIACSRADVFRGVALYAGAQLSGCAGGTEPIAYFGAHGLNDSVLNISQGRALRDRYATNNGCNATNPPEPANGSGSHICTSYEGCADGYPVRWCAFDGDHYPTQKDRGQAKSWIPGEAWDFISQF
ncbi:MAG TPA: malectin domain-containing carbohydrate-binding protein [Marinagarivorans sp.]